jgi:cobalamin biosynthesis Mg chelatase CobN
MENTKHNNIPKTDAVLKWDRLCSISQIATVMQYAESSRPIFQSGPILIKIRWNLTCFGPVRSCDVRLGGGSTPCSPWGALTSTNSTTNSTHVTSNATTTNTSNATSTTTPSISATTTRAARTSISTSTSTIIVLVLILVILLFVLAFLLLSLAQLLIPLATYCCSYY